MYLLLLFILISCFSTAEKAPPKIYTVEIKQMQFQPAELRIAKGDTVIWINRDFVTHDVTEEKSKLWSSKAMPSGASWRMVVRQSADYYCTIHQVMKGKLIVK
jgi:plastocyanin